VDPGSDAARKGIQRGDIIVALDGVRITSQEELESLVFTHQVGDIAEVTVYRSGRQATVQLTIQEDVK
jgi:S1-C subfamily serine protease